MLTLLKVVLVVLVLLWLGLRLLKALVKRWVTRKFGDYQASAALVDARFARPARVQLVPATAAQPGEGFQALWSGCAGLGFRALGDFEERGEAFELLRAARHQSLPIALVLSEDSEAAAGFAMFALTQANHLIAFSDGPGPGLTTGSMSWDVNPAHTPASALAALQAALRSTPVREPDLRLVQGVYENAWAARADAVIARVPTRAEIERRATEVAAGTAPALIERAFELAFGQWQAQVTAAALDRYRRSSGIDAVRWERMGGDIHVVHEHLRPQDVGAMLGAGEATDQLVAQFQQQGFKGIALYERVLERLPAAQQRQRIGDVQRPLRAALYARADVAGASAPARAHVYEGVDEQGRLRQGAVYAQDSTDAKRQLAGMGVGEARLLLEPAGSGPDAGGLVVDPATAAAAVRALRESTPMALLRAVWANAWLWAPPLLLLAWSLYDGPPYTWGDWLVLAYLLLALGGLLVFVAPILFYNELLRARLHARWNTARLHLFLLRRVNLLGGITPTQLLAEDCKIQASAGDLAGALERWRRQQSGMPAEQYLQGLSSIHDAAGDHQGMIAAQRAYLAQAQAKELATVDLALSLVKYQGAVDESESLLAQVSPASLSELALAGHHFARGLICAARGQQALAIRQYGQALEKAGQFRSNPLVLGMMAEINGHTALALKRAGDATKADALWQAVLPLLQIHATGLVRQYGAASGD